MKIISRVYRIMAWPICNQCLNLLQKNLISISSVCAQVSNFSNSVSCKQSKFQQKSHSTMENVDVKLWTKGINRCRRFSGTLVILTGILPALWTLRANIDCTIKLKWHFNYTHLSCLCMTSQFIIQAEFPFTNNRHEAVTFVCWEESITHNAEWTSHSALAIVTKEMLLQSWASAWCACTTHFTLGLRSVCQRNFCLDYSD